MIVLVDNYDSFTFNLQRYLMQLGQPVRVFRNDAPELQADLGKDYSAIVLSPGPKGPKDAGQCVDVVKRHSGQVPILGICLGHQVIFEAFGGTIGRAAKPMHGMNSPMKLEPSRIYDGIPSGTAFARYHSLIGVCSSLPPWLKVNAWCPEGQIMGIEHKEHPTFGVQFHPESVLSHHGHRLLSNFLHCVGGLNQNAIPEPDVDQAESCLMPEIEEPHFLLQETHVRTPAVLPGKRS